MLIWLLAALRFSDVAWCSAPPHGTAPPDGETLDLDLLDWLPATNEYNFSDIFPENYDKTVMPRGADGKPIKVYLTFELLNVLNIDEESGIIRYQTFLTFAWEDPRLAVPESARKYKSISLDATLHERLWVPDIFVFGQDEFEQGHLLRDIGSLDLLTNGHVMYSIYASFSVGCHLDFTTYPFDSHHCQLIFVSYSQTEDRMHMTWAPKHVQIYAEGRSMKFHTFTITFEEMDPQRLCVGQGSQRRYYRTAIVRTLLARSRTFFYWHTCLPCVLLVATSWLSLLLPPDVIPGRMVLCITSLLALLTMFTSSLGSMRVSYIRASDVWFVMCLLFDFLVILEYAVLLWMQRKRADRETSWTKVEPFPHVKEDKSDSKSEPKIDLCQRLQNPSYLDYVSRWVLAIMFAIFFIVFMAYNFSASAPSSDGLEHTC